jgi:uncharacterized LabA/DUF88 family protein
MENSARIYVACDVANLVKACRYQYGDDARLDFGMLGSVVPAILHPQLVDQVLTAYIVVHSKTSKSGNAIFQRALTHLGYRVRVREMSYTKIVKNEWKPNRTDWDVGITIDAIHHMCEYDTFVLMSGDGDFAMLLEYLHTHGKRTMVFTFESAASKLLYDAADTVVTLTEAVVTRKGV